MKSNEQAQNWADSCAHNVEYIRDERELCSVVWCADTCVGLHVKGAGKAEAEGRRMEGYQRVSGGGLVCDLM